MMRRLTILGVLGLLCACEGVSRLDLTTIGRDSWQRPDDVISVLDVTLGATVADLGAGDGYFLPYLSDAVGDQGRVLAVEVDDELVTILREQFFHNSNIEIIRGRFLNPFLPDGLVDLVLMVNVYHHIQDRIEYFRRLRADLGPAGRVAIIEPNADLGGLLSVFVGDGHASRSSDLRGEMEAAGYRLIGSYDLLPVQIFQIFGPADD